MTSSNTTLPQKARPSHNGKARIRAAVNLSNRYGVSLQHAKILADLQGVRIGGAHD